jgi:hypothetical protein
MAIDLLDERRLGGIQRCPPLRPKNLVAGLTAPRTSGRRADPPWKHQLGRNDEVDTVIGGITALAVAQKVIDQ